MRDIDAILARDSKNEAEREEIYDLIDDCVKEEADILDADVPSYRKLMEKTGNEELGSKVSDYVSALKVIEEASNRLRDVRNPRDIYKRTAGEVEARNAERRNFLPPERRRELPPSWTESVPRRDQIVRFSVSPVWTGSAADYDAPDLNYVGTGEGAHFRAVSGVRRAGGREGNGRRDEAIKRKARLRPDAAAKQSSEKPGSA